MKYKPKIAVTAALEELASLLTDTKTAMHVRLTKTIDQIAESKKAFDSVGFWQFTQTADDRGVDRKQLTQAAS